MLSAAAKDDDDLAGLLERAKAHDTFVVLSPKIDGIRVCIDIEAEAVLSRTGKRLGNTSVEAGLQALARRVKRMWTAEPGPYHIKEVAAGGLPVPRVLDGEVFLLRDGIPTSFPEVASAIRGEGNAPWDEDPGVEIWFQAFDLDFGGDESFMTRHHALKLLLEVHLPVTTGETAFHGVESFSLSPFRHYRLQQDHPDLREEERVSTIGCVSQKAVRRVEEIRQWHDFWVSKGFEGVMLRMASGPYKYGRSTLKEGGLVKVKMFSDSEAEILDVFPRMHNTNEAFKDATGKTKRSSKKEGKVPMEMMGTMLVRDVHTGVEVHVGSGNGVTDVLRQSIWLDRESYLGRFIKYRYLGVGHGENAKPRHPLFVCFMDESEIDTSS
jgi:ATP-dependent DNA ligase